MSHICWACQATYEGERGSGKCPRCENGGKESLTSNLKSYLAWLPLKGGGQLLGDWIDRKDVESLIGRLTQAEEKAEKRRLKLHELRSALGGMIEAARAVNIDRKEWYRSVAKPIQTAYQVLGVPGVSLSDEEIAALSGDSSAPETTTPHLLDQMTDALKKDPDLAWSWHCNLAMPIMDRVHCSHTAANEAAADLMRHLFHIDIRSNSNWAITVRPAEETTARKAVVGDIYLSCGCGAFAFWPPRKGYIEDAANRMHAHFGCDPGHPRSQVNGSGES